MTHKLHTDTGNEKFIALLAMNEEPQMETLSYDDAVVAPTMNTSTPGEGYTGINPRGSTRVCIRHAYIIR